MPVVSTRAAAATISQLISQFRTIHGDPASNVVTSANSDTRILQYLDWSLAHLYSMLLSDPSTATESVNLTYTDNADLVALPAGYEANSIIKVEHMDSNNDPTYIPYVPFESLDRYPASCWSPRGPHSISIRPKTAAPNTYRITFVGRFFPLSTIAEANRATTWHNMAVNHEELIVLGASVRMDMLNKNLDPMKHEHYRQLLEQFKHGAGSYTGPKFIVDAREFD